MNLVEKEALTMHFRKFSCSTVKLSQPRHHPAAKAAA
jgi:hypothetical protein